MKKLTSQFLVIAILVCCGMSANATKRTVNNGLLPTNPGQYATISSAISASASGDTIYVAGSSIPYNETVTIDRKITLIGAGYNPQYGYSSIINGGVAFCSNTNCNGSTIIGFQISYVARSNAYNVNITYSNISFIRNYFTSNGYYSGGGNFCLGAWVTSGITGANYAGGSGNYASWEPIFNYLTFRENVFTYNANVSFNDANVLFSNNIFLNGAGIWGNLSGTAPQITINHNLFLAGSYSSPLTTNYTAKPIQTKNSLIENNIFYGEVPADTTTTGTTYVNSYYNNITYCGSSIKALPWGYNLGSGNINNTNPLFTSIFTSSANPYLDFTNDNLTPQSSSPVLYAGNDSTNIGPTGGYYPIYDATRPGLTGEPSFPIIESIVPTGATSVNPGTPFSVQVKAKKVN